MRFAKVRYFIYIKKRLYLYVQIYLNAYLCLCNKMMNFSVSLRQDCRHQKEAICQIRSFLCGSLLLEAHHQNYWPMLSLPNSSYLRWKQTSVSWTTIGGFRKETDKLKFLSLKGKKTLTCVMETNLHIIQYVWQM